MVCLINLYESTFNTTIAIRYYLQPQVVSDKLQPNLGSLRLRIHYVSDYVFSSHFYDSLRNLLLSSLETKVTKFLIIQKVFILTLYIKFYYNNNLACHI